MNLGSSSIRGWASGLVCAALLLTAPAAGASEAPVFERDVLPIFTRYCFNCHGKSSPQLGLDLRTARLAMRGSQNGPVIVPGSLEDSLLWKKVSTREMPLALFKLKLSDAEIEIVRDWILAGAPTREATELPADVRRQFDRFENEVRPILAERCTDCHGADHPEGGLDLSNLAALVRGSSNGPVIVEGFSDKSVLVRKIASHAMPPRDAGEPLSNAEIRLITRWIDVGRFADFVEAGPRDDAAGAAEDAPAVQAEDRQFWSFQPPQVGALPPVRSRERIRTPVDHFVLSKLESHGLSFSPDASPRRLIRRAYLDLTGLPPTPAQAREFLNDRRPDAWERLIDRLLASPRYGERWGRHWLDAVGYVDTSDKDFNPNKVGLADGYWRYRDYVIAATNRDTAWDRFLVEQIAGDELVDWRRAAEYTPRMLDLLTATGYLRNVLDATDEDISNLPFDRYEALFKLMERVSSSTLGLTLACARCHSHKFDPIPQSDYYRFLSLFTAAYNPTDWLPPKQRFLYDVSQPQQAEIERQVRELSAAVDELEERLTQTRRPYRDRLQLAKLQKVPAELREAARVAVETDAKTRTAEQRKLAARYAKLIAVAEAEIDQALSAADRRVGRDLQARLQTLRTRLDSLQLNKIQALWDVGQPPVIRLLHRGDVDFAGPRVTPGFLSVLSAPGTADAIPSARAVGETTGLRLAFAEWLTDPAHPLATRVIVNRIWQHHFGSGLVATPDNFGSSGARPSHPALLDWLAVQFREQGWSAKRLHRLLMTSTVYRQSSGRRVAGPQSALAHTVDPQNRLLWRMNLQRLSAESVRDSIIAASGAADYAMGGPPVMLSATPSGLQRIDQQQRGQRRSVYLLSRRSYPLTFLRVFDFPVIDVNCTRRVESATPLQSLTMINSDFMAKSAERLAGRVEREAGGQAAWDEKIATAYWLILCRPPSAAEVVDAEQHLHRLEELYLNATVETDQQGDGDRRAEHARRSSFQNLIHMLLCSNEFLYVD